MLTPESIDQLTSRLVLLYRDAEQEILVAVAKQVERSLSGEEQIVGERRLRTETRRIVARLQRARAREVKALMAEAYTAGVLAAAEVLDQ